MVKELTGCYNGVVCAITDWGASGQGNRVCSKHSQVCDMFENRLDENLEIWNSLLHGLSFHQLYMWFLSEGMLHFDLSWLSDASDCSWESVGTITPLLGDTWKEQKDKGHISVELSILEAKLNSQKGNQF